MTDDADGVARALVETCFRCGVDPADGSATAAERVAGRLVADLAEHDIVVDPRDYSGPEACPLNRWLQLATGLTAAPGTPRVPVLLMGCDRAILRRPAGDGERSTEFVPLPPALRAAVAFIGARRGRSIEQKASA